MSLFIAGSGRSGTTLLVDWLGCHPNLSPIYETNFITALIQVIARGGDRREVLRQCAQILDEWCAPLPHRPHSKRSHERYLHGPHYVLFSREVALAHGRTFLHGVAQGTPWEALRRLMDELFAEHATLDGKPRWLNKTPAYLQMAGVLRGLYPELRMLICVRDGRDVAASVLTRPWGPDNLPDAAQWWVKHVQRGEAFVDTNPEHALIVRYEDLLVDPEPTLARALRFLGEDPADAVPLVQAYQAAGIQLDPSRGGSWRSRWTQSDQDHFLGIAGETLERNGYAC